MNTKKKTDAVKFLEGLTGGPITFGKLLEAIRVGEEMTQLKTQSRCKSCVKNFFQQCLPTNKDGCVSNRPRPLFLPYSGILVRETETECGI
jgi:hypothetical protein